MRVAKLVVFSGLIGFTDFAIAQDGGSLPEYIKTIILVLPALLAPVIAWFLSQQGVSRRAKEVESLLSRMELVEKLRHVQEQSPNSSARFGDALDKEVNDILDDLELAPLVLFH